MSTKVHHICAKCSSTEAVFRKMDRFKPEVDRTLVVQPYTILCAACGHYEDFYTKTRVDDSSDWGDGNRALELL